ncbi:MAG: hypothetical protein M3387_08085 [Actinomycetota bacterium]|nr:hypothetical protein [Actinomycetota bacterium]
MGLHIRIRTATTRLLALTMFASVFAVGAALPAGAATPVRGSFLGSAYASFANATAGQVATTLGRSAYIVTGCQGTGGDLHTNTVDSVNAGKALRARGTRTTVRTVRADDSAVVRTTSRVAGLRALDGLITADAVRSVAKTTATHRRISNSAIGSKFVDLQVAGTPVEAKVARNSKLSLPGLGYVVLNRVVQRKAPGRKTLIVEGMRVVITESNDFGLPVGSRITVAQARSGFDRDQPEAVIDGAAYATSGKFSTPDLTNQAGRSAAIYLGCRELDRPVQTNSINRTGIDGVGSTGNGTTSAEGRTTKTGGIAAITTARNEDLDLLDGLVTADAVRARAQTRREASSSSAKTDGSRFVNLRVLGVSMPDGTVAPNTTVELPGIGRVILFQTRVKRSSERVSLAVKMVRLIIEEGNERGLPAGQVIVSSAASSVREF